MLFFRVDPLFSLFFNSGSDESKRHLAALEQSRHFADCVQVAQKENRLSNEEDLFYATLKASAITTSPSSSHLSIGDNRTPPRRLAITAASSDDPVLDDSDIEKTEIPSSSTPNEQEQSITNQSQLSNCDDTLDDDLSQRTLTQLNISQQEKNIDKDIDHDDDLIETTHVSTSDDISTGFNADEERDNTDVTPKSQEMSRPKRKLTDNISDDSNESLVVPEKRSKLDNTPSIRFIFISKC